MKSIGPPGDRETPSPRIMTAPPTLITSHAIRNDMASCKPKTPSAPSSVSESPANQYLLAAFVDAVVFRAAAKSAGISPKSISHDPPVSM